MRPQNFAANNYVLKWAPFNTLNPGAEPLRWKSTAWALDFSSRHGERQATSSAGSRILDVPRAEAKFKATILVHHLGEQPAF